MFRKVKLKTDHCKLITSEKKGGQDTHITPLRPPTLAPFPAWGIQQELVV